VNFDDSTITLSWKQIEDNCNSIFEIIIYGNENNGAFQKIVSISNPALTEYSHYIPNLNTTRKYYLSVLYTCNGSDSLLSDTISPDLTYPENLSLDSVSYSEDNTIIAGWKPNNSSDTRGYQIYNYSSGNGDSIGFTTSTSYLVSNNPTDRFPVVIATLDSCNLSSTLSTPHRIMWLSGTIDTCSKEIKLNWSLYMGWNTIDSQALFVSINKQAYTRHFSSTSSITPSTTILIFNDFNLGDTIRFFIRAYTSSGTITSSSNRINFETRKLSKPEEFYLYRVTVENDEIMGTLMWDDLNDQDRIEILRSNSSGSNLSSLVINKSNLIGSNYTFVDNDVVVNQQFYNYKALLINKCNDVVDSSTLQNSILLSLTNQANYNPYVNWNGEVGQYLLEYAKDGFTWNTVSSSNNTSIELDSVPSGCYRITATEVDNPFTNNAISRSNVVCVQDSLELYIPTAINLSTHNNRFVILGKGIDHQKSTYEIYTRWGEKIVSAPTSFTWNGKYKDAEITPGVYIYIVNAFGILGEKQTLTGTLYVIR
jgi:hypothetical protein